MSLLATMYGQGYNANAGAFNWYPSAGANQLQQVVPNMVHHPQHQQHLRGQYAATSTTSYHHLMDAPPSNSREMRNRAEKMRRDKLNAFIGELATLVPMVSRSAKRMDKTSILRLTASHLRIHQRLLNRRDDLNLNIPDVIDQSLLEDLVQDQLRGFLMILTTSGKIVFVSQAVEHLLGHLQTDLMGQSIFNLISADDTDRFRMYINTVNDISDNDWRKYFNMHLKRAGPRNEAAVYEVVNITGTQLRDATAIPTCSSSNRELAIPTNTGSNDLWIFFMRVLKSDLTIEQAIDNNDEYITRHLLDGRIINCDHRISFIAGYLKEEVSGISAFKYMHREEVRWVMIALRQMYDRGESRGSSCYRLLSRTGQFIYLRTTGYLEIDNTGTVESFICVNAVVSEREGQELIKQMKERYSALIKNGSSLTRSNDTEALQGVDDPQQLEVAIAHLLHRLPSPDSDNESNSSPRSVIGESQDFNHSDTNHSTTSSSSTTNYPYCLKVKPSAGKRPPSIVTLQEASSATKRHKTSQSSDDGLGDSVSTGSTTSPSASSLTSTSSLQQGSYHITDISDNR